MISAGNSYSEDQLMHIFLDKFHQVGKYSVHIEIQQAELRREENVPTNLNYYMSTELLFKS